MFFLLMSVPVIYKLVSKKKHRAEVSLKPDEKKLKPVSAPQLSPRKAHCPECGSDIGPLAIISGWDKWGRFICPGCGRQIGFKNWLLTIVIIFCLLFGLERLFHFLLVSSMPLWISFTASFLAAVFIMFMVPMVWKYRRLK